MEEEIKYVPGIESINTKDIMPYLKESHKETVISWSSRLFFDNGKKADFVLQNTVEELEPETLSALNGYLPNYAIGPINFSKNLPKVTRSFWSESDCTFWLDSKPPGSVLYISFGSFVHASRHVIEEVARGLALSGVNFLWVIREGILGGAADGDAEVLPRGFRDEVRDRGLIVGWCDQVKVLSHPAVGGFWTHNGWNSTVESAWCGVPMVCLPFAFDQPCNRKLVVDDWGIGVNLGDGGSLDGGHVAATIKEVMNGEKLRENAGRVKETMRNAMESGGSSERNFDRFIKDLEGKVRYGM